MSLFGEILRSLASCPCCGCLVLARSYRERTRALDVVWDPSWGERRIIRSLLTREDVERQGFGLIVAGPHECPPEEECALERWGKGRET